jgi:hypothetical protein
MMRSRWSGNILLEPELKYFGMATAPGMAPGMLIHIKCYKKAIFFILKFDILLEIY